MEFGESKRQQFEVWEGTKSKNWSSGREKIKYSESEERKNLNSGAMGAKKSKI